MSNVIDPKHLSADLKLPWLIVGIMVVELVALVLTTQLMGDSLLHPLPEPQRELIRTVLYVVAIITLPSTNLLRHIQLRLNQTMPLEHSDAHKAAKNRYLLTVIVSMALLQTIGIFGFIMFVLGDSLNTLVIFMMMAALGLFLYRPKLVEYQQIVSALTAKN